MKTLRALAIAAAICLCLPALASNSGNSPPRPAGGSGGGGGGVTSVTGAGGCVSVTGTTAVTVTSTGCQSSLTSASAANLTSKFILQGTTDTGAPNAQFLGALGTGILKNTTSTGVLSIATPGTDYVVPSGVSGGQAINGGTGTGDTLTLTSTSNSTLGPVVVNGSYISVPEVMRLNNDPNTTLTGFVGQFYFASSGSNILFISPVSGTQWAFIPYYTFSSGAAITQTHGTVFEWSVTPPTQVAATGSLLNEIVYDASTATFTGGTPISTNTLARFDIEANTITDSTAVTISKAATLRIGGATIAAGSVTITSRRALQIAGGTAEFDGGLDFNGAVVANGTGTISLTNVAPASAHATCQEFFAVIGSGGSTRYLCGL